MKALPGHTLAVLIVTGVLAAGCVDAPTTPTSPEASVTSAAPLLAAAPGQGIPERYIVVFHDETQDAIRLAARLVREHGGKLHHTYQHALRGFSGTLSANAVEALRRNPNVAYVQEDGIASASGIQYSAPWGLDRIDQADRPLNQTYTYNATGSGVRIYVIDTGIRYDHVDFGGRASAGYDAFGGDGSDCNGHGTHVAGTAAGTTYGVAKSAALVAIRVLDCGGYGSWSDVIAGVDWVTYNHVKPAVANMSLGGGGNTALDNAVANSIAAGVTYAVAAGNDDNNACYYSPARVSAALTVGSSTGLDARSPNSNYGSCLDLFAPGLNTISAWHTSSTATNMISGTSMASPHVAGVAALYLQNNPTAAPAAVVSTIVGWAFTYKLTDIGSGSPNRLLNAPLIAPLVVDLSCNYAYGATWQCVAYATGGSGSGYSFTWYNTGWGYATNDPASSGYFVYCDSGYSQMNAPTSATVSVSDGGGRTATRSVPLGCEALNW